MIARDRKMQITDACQAGIADLTRLVDETGDVAALWAVGVAWADRPPTIRPVRIDRELSNDGLLVRIGAQPSSTTGRPAS